MFSGSISVSSPFGAANNYLQIPESEYGKIGIELANQAWKMFEEKGLDKRGVRLEYRNNKIVVLNGRDFSVEIQDLFNRLKTKSTSALWALQIDGERSPEGDLQVVFKPVRLDRPRKFSGLLKV